MLHDYKVLLKNLYSTVLISEQDHLFENENTKIFIYLLFDVDYK